MNIPYFQTLNQEGALTKTLPSFASNEKLLSLYKSMSLIRAFDKKAVALQRTGQLGTYPSTLGQEAISTAIGATLDKDDVYVPYYRDHGALYMRGVKLSELFLYWGGDERGNNYQNNKFDFPPCVPVASQCLLAAGVGFAMKNLKKPNAVLVQCGDGGTSKGDFYEAINLAGVWDLPVIFVINNNQWAISVPLNKQTRAKTIAQKAIAAGFDGIQVDGNDIIALSEQIDLAAAKAKSGKGPTLIEALTYRLSDHTTADDASRYVKKDDLANAWKCEPIARLETYLVQNNILTTELKEKIHSTITKELDDEVKTYLNTEKQDISSIFDFMYATLPKDLVEQKNELLKEQEYA